MKDKPFPVLGYEKHIDCPSSVKWSELDDKWAMRVHSQTLERLAERGGLSPVEIVFNVNKLKWATPVNPEFALDLVRSIEYVDKPAMKDKEALRTLLIDVLNCGADLGWTELGKYGAANENISLREAIQDELNLCATYQDDEYKAKVIEAVNEAYLNLGDIYTSLDMYNDAIEAIENIDFSAGHQDEWISVSEPPTNKNNED